MGTPDSEHITKDDFEVEIIDLDAPSSPAPARLAGQSQRLSLRVRIGMGIAILAAVALLGAVVLKSVLSPSQAAKTSLTPQVHYQLSLTVDDGTGYAITANGIVSAFRVSDGKLLWHHTVKNVGQESITVVDGVVYLIPSVLYDSSATTAPLVALRAADGSLLWSRSLPWTEASFQLTVANGSVYIRTAVDTIEVLRATLR